jgi:tol-pal system protein YbgF
MVSQPRILLCAALAATVIAAPVVPAQEQPEYLDRPFGYGERTRDEVPQRTAHGSPADVILRVERLEGQIRQLTGIIEQLQYRNQQLEQQVRRFQEGAEGPRAATRPPAQPAPLPPVTAAEPSAGMSPIPGRRSDAFDPTLDPHAPGAPRPLGTPGQASAPLPPPLAAEAPIGAPGGRGAGRPLDLGTLAGTAAREPLPPPPPRPPGGVAAVLPPSQTPKDEYDLAYGYVLRKDYALAEDQFRSFLHKYPNDRLVPDAHYWLGESLFQRQRYLDAAESFLSVSTKYETTGKAPDALLRLGQSLAALGEREQACAAFGRIGVKYPRASASIRQGVEREQKRARC